MKKKESRISVKKKRWYSVLAPKILNNVVVGETPAADPSMLVGRTFAVNLSSVMRNMRKQNVEVRFKIKEVKGNECITDFVSYEILPAHVKRLVKRAKCRVDDSFVVETKDKLKVRVKPLILARDTTQKSVAGALRKTAKEMIIERIGKTDYSEFLNKVLVGEVQRDLKTRLRKIYPLSVAEIRAMKRL
ncbi:hypothetical protein HOD38_05055 [archaeon]|nr:hypothetical protein [archaeon]MBT4397608.1 hypothetical protein [archaeon]MBT4441093.1 hypothetical protein [archaeon]